MHTQSWLIRFIVVTLVVGLIYYIVYIPRDDIQSLTSSYLVIDREGVKDITSKRPVGWYSPQKDLSKVVKTIIISEDWAFFSHFGVDVRQIYESILDTIQGDRLRGASTISQQVVKNIFFNSQRSIIRKVHELFFTLYLENYVPKRKILELYLNLIELGPGVYGLGQASEYYFSKEPDELTWRESAFIAMLLPSPIKYGQSFRDKKLTDFAQKSISRIFSKLVLAKYIKEEEVDALNARYFHWEEKPLEEDDDAWISNEF